MTLIKTPRAVALDGANEMTARECTTYESASPSDIRDFACLQSLECCAVCGDDVADGIAREIEEQPVVAQSGAPEAGQKLGALDRPRMKEPISAVGVSC